jgi:hypothetical protein
MPFGAPRYHIPGSRVVAPKKLKNEPGGCSVWVGTHRPPLLDRRLNTRAAARYANGRSAGNPETKRGPLGERF